MISEARVYDTKMIDALTVPAIAVVRDLRGLPFVYVYDSTRERVFARQVEVGQLIGSEVDINSGLKPEDQIVVAGQQNVHEGSLVHVAGGGQ
jgi:multidrug efflux pump subunit AcrA (membrane-fusion protein)